jgi:hypothetical protein
MVLGISRNWKAALRGGIEVPFLRNLILNPDFIKGVPERINRYR